MKNRWNALSRTKKIVVAVVAFFLVTSIIGAIFPSEKKNESSTSSNVKTDESTIATALSPEQKLTKLINDSAGKDSNLDGINVRIKSLDIASDQVLIDMYGDENLTEGMMKSANRRLILKAIDAYQASGLKAKEVSISVWFPLVDEVGVSTLRRVLSYGFSASQIAKIQTENIDTKSMDNGMADVYTVVYPAFRW
jgi:hypothetical protein